ncbi:MAG: hypothetical protein ACON4M_04605 [Crocinitomicaceae bacterium]
MILFQSLFLVFNHYQFNIIYFNNPLGYNPIDAEFYNEIGIKISKLNFEEMITFISNNLRIGDFGFPFFLWFAYYDGLDGILIVKFLNILIHLISSIYVFKLSKFFFSDYKLQKLTLSFFAINPLVIYYASSGLKEILFSFFIISGIYYLYRGNIKNYIIGIILISLTGFFRVYIPFLILLSMGIFIFFKQKGKIGHLKKVIIILIFTTIFFGVFSLLKTELIGKMNTNADYILEYRLGRKPSIIDRFLLFVGGLFGPFPSFQYDKGHIANLLESIGNFIKIYVSGYFSIGIFYVIRNKMVSYYPIIFIYVFNILLLSILGLSLDPRFSFIFHFIYFTLVILGYYKTENNFKLRKYNLVHTISILLLVVLYNLR